MRTINNNTQRRADAVWTIMPSPDTQWHPGTMVHSGTWWGPNTSSSAHWDLGLNQPGSCRDKHWTGARQGMAASDNWNFNGSNHRSSQHPIVQFSLMQKEIPLNVEYHYCDCLLAMLEMDLKVFTSTWKWMHSWYAPIHQQIRTKALFLPQN